MGERMYRSALGWREEDDKHIATHMLISLEEYKNICDERNAAMHEKEKMGMSLKKYKRDAEYQSEIAIAKIKEQAEQRVLDAEERTRMVMEEVETLRGLNRNLIRICTERANAQRGLRPKKKHSGYKFSGKIMQSKAFVECTNQGNVYADTWTAILETPYDGTIPIAQIQNQIMNDLMKVDGVLEKLCINYYVFSKTEALWKGSYSEAVNDDSKNYLYDYKFQINARSGLWEIQIYTTEAIRIVAEFMG